MGSVTVLLSAMGLSDISILKKLNITGPSIVINQCGSDGRQYFPEEDCLFISTSERGLSRSRNMAIREAVDGNERLCILCDNDVVYEDDYREIISAAFDRNQDADILIFFIKRPERQEPVLKKEGDLGLLHSMKIFSPEIAFRLSSIRKAGLKMDTAFGAGAEYGMGEENIFLFDAFRKGLKIRYIPIRIASTIENESTWFKGYTEEFFRNRGAGYYRMSESLYPLLCLQFALRKRGLYKDSLSIFKALKAMGKGKREYKAGRRRYFIAGDHYSGTGPANATEALIRAMPVITLYQKRRGKLSRIPELIRNTGKSDAVVFSGHSRQNILGMRIAARFGVPSVYIMHGAVEYENRINRVPDDKMAADEREMMKLADRILAVSSRFEGWLKENYPEYAGKIGHLLNGVDRDKFFGDENYVNQSDNTPVFILSVGGGMPRKKIIRICEAVKLLREKYGRDVRLEVAGAAGADSGEIRAFDFVNDNGLLKEEDMKKLYRKCQIFIQNSIFETFGLAPVEALLSGCDIMVSEFCGVLEILKGAGDGDIIKNPDDSTEIAEKIWCLLKGGNNKRLLSSLDTMECGWEKRAEELCLMLEGLKK